MTVNVDPAIVNVPTRLLPVLFCAAAYATVPFPLPLDPLVTVSQLSLLTAVHAQPDCVFTDTLPVPPDFSNVLLIGEIS